jgi:hypothetical protein
MLGSGCCHFSHCILFVSWLSAPIRLRTAAFLILPAKHKALLGTENCLHHLSDANFRLFYVLASCGARIRIGNAAAGAGLFLL